MKDYIPSCMGWVSVVAITVGAWMIHPGLGVIVAAVFISRIVYLWRRL